VHHRSARGLSKKSFSTVGRIAEKNSAARERMASSPTCPLALNVRMNVSQIYDDENEPIEMKIDPVKEAANQAALLRRL
jgi:hypothetical protein